MYSAGTTGPILLTGAGKENIGQLGTRLNFYIANKAVQLLHDTVITIFYPVYKETVHRYH